MIHLKGYNYNKIREIINACENLAGAGKEDEAKNILVNLAREILKDEND